MTYLFHQRASNARSVKVQKQNKHEIYVDDKWGAKWIFLTLKSDSWLNLVIIQQLKARTALARRSYKPWEVSARATFSANFCHFLVSNRRLKQTKFWYREVICSSFQTRMRSKRQVEHADWILLSELNRQRYFPYYRLCISCSKSWTRRGVLLIFEIAGRFWTRRWRQISDASASIGTRNYR